MWMGTPATCTVRGREIMPSKRMWRPWKLATSEAQISRSAWMSSSVRAPRVLKSMPTDSSSSRIQPTPMPSRSRPPDRTSMVASRLARGSAWCSGRTSTPVANTMRRVWAARKASRSRGSGMGQSSGRGMRPPEA